MNEDKKKEQSRTLEGILALTGSLGVLFLNSMTLYSLMDKAGIYEAQTPATMNAYVALNLPVAFSAATGAFVIGKYIGSWLDKQRNKS